MALQVGKNAGTAVFMCLFCLDDYFWRQEAKMTATGKRPDSGFPWPKRLQLFQVSPGRALAVDGKIKGISGIDLQFSGRDLQVETFLEPAYKTYSSDASGRNIRNGRVRESPRMSMTAQKNGLQIKIMAGSKARPARLNQQRMGPS